MLSFSLFLSKFLQNLPTKRGREDSSYKLNLSSYYHDFIYITNEYIAKMSDIYPFHLYLYICLFKKCKIKKEIIL